MASCQKRKAFLDLTTRILHLIELFQIYLESTCSQLEPAFFRIFPGNIRIRILDILHDVRCSRNRLNISILNDFKQIACSPNTSIRPNSDVHSSGVHHSCRSEARVRSGRTALESATDMSVVTRLLSFTLTGRCRMAILVSFTA